MQYRILQHMDNKQKKELKSLAHHLKPVVITGNNGMTPSVNQEIEVALNAHELIKLRINTSNKEERDAIVAEMLVTHRAELIQKIGHTITIYRKNHD